jgi:hypothetical protein
MKTVKKYIQNMESCEQTLVEVETQLLDSSFLGIVRKKNYDDYANKLLTIASFLHLVEQELCLIQPTNEYESQIILRVREVAISIGGAAAKLHHINAGLQRKTKLESYSMSTYRADLHEYQNMSYFYKDSIRLMFDALTASKQNIALNNSDIITSNYDLKQNVKADLQEKKLAKSWYKAQYGIGNKLLELYFLDYEVKRVVSPDAGYKFVSRHPRNYGQIIPDIVFDTEIDIPVIKNNFISSHCPKCDFVVTARYELHIYFNCSSCGCKWKQRGE